MKKIITTLSILTLLLLTSINVQATTADAIFKEYSKVISWFLPLREPLPKNIYYGVYDIDKNGIPEFILRDYHYETKSPYHIYTYTSSGLVYLGEYEGVYSSIYEYNGNGFAYFSASGGYGVIYLYELKNNSLKKIREIEVTPQNYHEPGQIFAGADKPIKLYSYRDTVYTYTSNISYEVSKRTKAGVKIGNVLNTDVRTYVNGIEIPCFSINNRCVVVAEDLRSCGFSVEWDQFSNSLVISKNTYPVFKNMTIPNKQKKGSVFSPIYSTNIDVYYKNATGTSKLDAHAINGYMMISPESISDSGVSFNYNDAYRRLDINLSSKDGMNAFYGVWCSSSKNKTNAEIFAQELNSKGFNAQIFVTTDWNELNPEMFYVVTAGVCATKEEAEQLLIRVKQEGYSNAYVKYTGNRK